MGTFLFVGEGPSDIGRSERPDESWEGALVAYVRRTIESHVGRPPAFFPERKRWKEVPARLHGLNRSLLKRLGGYGAKVHLLVTRSAADGFEAVVCSFDRDTRHGYRLKEARDGRGQARNDGQTLPCVIAMPIEMVEAWLLGDSNAVRAIFPGVDPEPVSHPEGIRDPKALLAQLIREGHCRKIEVYETLTSRGAMETLRQTCPSFAAFQDEISSEIVRGLGLS